MATRRNVTDSPAEQGLEVGPSGSGSPLNVRTRKHPAREVSTSGCGPVRCRRGLRVTARSPAILRNGKAAADPSGSDHDGLRVVVARLALAAPPARRWEVEQGSVPKPPSVAPFGTLTAPELEHDDVGVSRFADEIGASSMGPSGTCMRPFNGLSPPRTSSEACTGGISTAPSLCEQAGQRATIDRSLDAGRTRVETARRQRPR